MKTPDSWIGWITVWLILAAVIVLFGLMGCYKPAPHRFVEACVKACEESGEVMHAAMDREGRGLVCSCWRTSEDK